MNKESLDKSCVAIFKALRDLEIDNCDKLELMININRFLDDRLYEKTIRVLQVYELDKKRDRK